MTDTVDRLQHAGLASRLLEGDVDGLRFPVPFTDILDAGELIIGQDRMRQSESVHVFFGCF